MKKLLGTITSGSLTEGLIMRIDPETQLETIKTGKFVSVVGNQHVFFSLITDLALEVTNPDILLYPPAENEKLLQKLLKQSAPVRRRQMQGEEVRHPQLHRVPVGHI